MVADGDCGIELDRHSVPTYGPRTGDDGLPLCRFAQVPRRDAAMLDISNPIEKGILMSGGWILLGLAVFGVVVKAIGWSYARAQRADLGFVSRRWISEQHF